MRNNVSEPIIPLRGKTAMEIKKLGEDGTAWKFSDLVRMNRHRPQLKEIALHDLR